MIPRRRKQASWHDCSWIYFLKIKLLNDASSPSSVYICQKTRVRQKKEADAVHGAGDDDGEAQIPIIDHRRLLLELDRRGEESARLHTACQDWGFFQVSLFVGLAHIFICTPATIDMQRQLTSSGIIYMYVCLIILMIARIALLFVCS